MKQLLGSLLMVLPLCAQWGNHFLPDHEVTLIREGGAPEALRVFSPAPRRDGVLVIVKAKNADSKADAFAVTLRYKTEDGKVFVRTQIIPRKNGADSFWVGRAEPISVSVKDIEWVSKEESATK